MKWEAKKYEADMENEKGSGKKKRSFCELKGDRWIDIRI